MIVSRTPLRISFLGGGTDYPAWYREHGGAVLSATIDKYTWLTLRRLPPFFPHKNRLSYRMIETTNTIGEIKHPTARAVLEHLDVHDVEVGHTGDLPARSGMGTSSAFTVGFLNACHALKGKRVRKADLATEAIEIEQAVLKETVGSQDQVAAAYGGLNKITFWPASTRDLPEFSVEPIPLPPARVEEFHQHLLLFFTGLSRTASEVADTFVPDLDKREAAMRATATRVETGLRILSDLGPIEDFGEVLHDAWMDKRKLSEKVSTPEIDELYQGARDAGAIGGKLLGAGGGGFLLIFARPRYHDAIKARLGGAPRIHVTFRFENQGSSIVWYDP